MFYEVPIKMYLILLVLFPVIVLKTTNCAELGLIDLSHNYNKDIPYWPATGYNGWEYKEVMKGSEGRGFWVASNSFCASEHTGTHIDAPYHFFKGGWTVDKIPQNRFSGPAVVINITERASQNPNAAIMREDLENWEEVNGQIPEGAIVLMSSGWDRFWTNKTAYLGTELKDRMDLLRFPGFSGEAARFLAQFRRIHGIGVDTVSGDKGQASTDVPAHRVLASAKIWILENLKGVDRLPPAGATVYAFCLKIDGGTGAPCRVIASLDKNAIGEWAVTDSANQKSIYNFVLVTGMILLKFMK